MILAIMSISFCVSAQSTITYYDKYGQKQSSAKVEPVYQPRPSFQGSEYRSNVPLEMATKVMAQKQQLYDQRKQQIQEKLEVIASTGSRLLSSYPESYKYLSDELTAFVSKLNKGSYDLSLNSVYNPLFEELKDIEESVYLTYEMLIKESAAKH